MILFAVLYLEFVSKNIVMMQTHACMSQRNFAILLSVPASLVLYLCGLLALVDTAANGSMSSIPDATAAVLQAANATQYFQAEGPKLKCTLNGHCLPLDNVAPLSVFLRCATESCPRNTHILLLHASLVAAQWMEALAGWRSLCLPSKDLGKVLALC